MNPAQSKIVAEYCRRTPGSAKLNQEARQVFPSGVTHDARYLLPYGIYVDRARGSHKWDVDGNEYIDYTGGHGALLLGHNHPDVVRAVQAQLERGTHYGSNQELEIRWGQLVQKLIPSAERVRFTSSGTEATLLALRLARAATGRTKILRFKGHFHGWHDHMAFGVNSHYDGTPTPGVLSELAEQVVLLPPGDVAALRETLSSRDDIAGAIIEPTGASWGQVPVAPDFLHALRDETAKHGVVLVFDEVITGFRCSPGGAQAALGITPDLTTLAKILAGGFPGGAIAGKRDLMELIAFPEEEASGREKIPHHGTYNANPVSAAAGAACLKVVAETDACERANRTADRLRAQLNEVLAREQVNWQIYGTYSGFHIFTNPENLPLTPGDLDAGKLDYAAIKAAKKNSALHTKLRLAMLLQGVDLFGWPGGPTSAAHTPEDIDRTVEAFGAALALLRDENEIA